jgi:hypothetical protein
MIKNVARKYFFKKTKVKVKLKYLTLVNSQTDTTCAIIILCALGLRFLS